MSLSSLSLRNAWGMSACVIPRPLWTATARRIRMDLNVVIGLKVLKKSTPSFCKKPRATRRALHLPKAPSARPVPVLHHQYDTRWNRFAIGRHFYAGESADSNQVIEFFSNSLEHWLVLLSRYILKVCWLLFLNFNYKSICVHLFRDHDDFRSVIADHVLCNQSAKHSLININIVTVRIRCTRFPNRRLLFARATVSASSKFFEAKL